LNSHGFAANAIDRLFARGKIVDVDMIEALQSGAIRMLEQIDWGAIPDATLNVHEHIVLRLQSIETVQDVHEYVEVEVANLVARILALDEIMAVERSTNLHNVNAASTVSFDEL